MRTGLSDVTRVMSALAAAATIAAGRSGRRARAHERLHRDGGWSADATVGTSGGPSKGEYRYYGVAASKQIARDPSDSQPCHGRLSDADERPFDRRSRHRHSSVSGRVYTTRPFRDDVGR